jgi:hypothetical protein
MRIKLRPTPLRDVAGTVGKWTTLAGSLIVALVGFGLLTAVQEDALVGLLGLIPGLLTAVTSALVAFGIVRQAEPLVTPVSDPQDNAGRSLVPVA